MNDLSVRTDGFSLQLTSALDGRFFVRLESPSEVADRATFSDFALSPKSTELAFDALRYVEEHVPSVFTAETWVVTNLLPTKDSETTSDNPELVRRFDELKALFRAYSEGSRRTLVNAYMQPRLGKFDGIFMFKNESSKLKDIFKKLFGRA